MSTMPRHPLHVPLVSRFSAPVGFEPASPGSPILVPMAAKPADEEPPAKAPIPPRRKLLVRRRVYDGLRARQRERPEDEAEIAAARARIAAAHAKRVRKAQRRLELEGRA